MKDRRELVREREKEVRMREENYKGKKSKRAKKLKEREESEREQKRTFGKKTEYERDDERGVRECEIEKESDKRRTEKHTLNLRIQLRYLWMAI